MAALGTAVASVADYAEQINRQTSTQMAGFSAQLGGNQKATGWLFGKVSSFVAAVTAEKEAGRGLVLQAVCHGLQQERARAAHA